MAEQSIKVFFSYSREDKPLRDRLEIHLSSLRQQGVISAWHNRQIVAGSEWEEEVDRHLKTADIILLLISPDFVASKYCYEIELPDAIARHEAGEAYVVPILLRPTAGWKNLPFAKLQVYPSGGKAVTLWGNEDEAFVDVAEGIAIAVAQLLEGRERRRLEQKRQKQECLKREQEQEQRRIAEVQRQEAEAVEREEQAKRAEQAKLAEFREEQRRAAKAEEQERLKRAEEQEQRRIAEMRREAEAAEREEQANRTEQAKLAEAARSAEQTQVKSEKAVQELKELPDRARRSPSLPSGQVATGIKLLALASAIALTPLVTANSFSTFDRLVRQGQGRYTEPDKEIPFFLVLALVIGVFLVFVIIASDITFSSSVVVAPTS
jgi:hypothetical protein